MSVSRNQLITALALKIPHDILNHLLDEYNHIKHQFLLRRYQPSELNGGRFGECVLRLLEYLDTGAYTPFGSQIKSSDGIINRIQNNTTYPESVRLLIPRLTRVVLDVRNKRNVAHVGGEVSPNYSDSLFISHCVDWIFTEIVRHFYCCSIDVAKDIVFNINEIRIPVVAEIDGFVRVQNTKLDAKDKVLLVLYYKNPFKVRDSDLAKWIKYSNLSRFKSQILSSLDSEACIHYEKDYCVLLPKGIVYVEKNISIDLLI